MFGDVAKPILISEEDITGRFIGWLWVGYRGKCRCRWLQSEGGVVAGWRGEGGG